MLTILKRKLKLVKLLLRVRFTALYKKKKTQVARGLILKQERGVLTNLLRVVTILLHGVINYLMQNKLVVTLLSGQRMYHSIN